MYDVEFRRVRLVVVPDPARHNFLFHCRIFAMLKPEESWLARWEGLSSFLPGVYALRMYGEMPEEVEQMLRDNELTSRALKPEGAQ